MSMEALKNHATMHLNLFDKHSYAMYNLCKLDKKRENIYAIYLNSCKNLFEYGVLLSTTEKDIFASQYSTYLYICKMKYYQKHNATRNECLA